MQRNARYSLVYNRLAIIALALGIACLTQAQLPIPVTLFGGVNWQFINGRCDGAGAGGGTFTTTAINYALADIVLISVARHDATFTVTSTGSPVALTGASIAQQTGSNGTRFYYDYGVGSSYTVTGTGAGTFAAICTLAFKGAKLTTPVDQENGLVRVNGNGTSFQVGSITPTTNNQLLISSTTFVIPAVSSVQIDSGFTKQVSIDLIGSQSYGQVFAWRVQSTATAINPTWSGLSNADGQEGSIASFKGR